jgi:hypothetical protein
MKNPVKSLVEWGKSKVEKVKNNSEINDMATEATALMDEYLYAEKEKQPWNDKFDHEEKIYVGNRKFGNTRESSASDDARTPIRISQSIIEAQIDLNIPEAVFKPIAQDDEEAVKKLQAEADYTVRSSDLDEVNSSSERVVKKHGIACYKILWDFNYQGPGFRGRPEIIEVHPKNILWAAGTTDKNKWRCAYHVENLTLQECKGKYGKIASKLPDYGLCADLKYDFVGNNNGSTINNTNDPNAQIDLLTVQKNNPMAKYAIIEKWYLDDDDELCLTVFSDKLILLKKPKFYHRRKYDAEKEQYVFDKKGNETFEDTFTLEEDYLSYSKEIPETKIPKGTEIPYYYPKGPKSIPIVIQNNIPRSKSMVGISDIERTADFEETMKKMIYKHEEKILNGTTKVLYNKDQEEEAAAMLDNDELTVIGVKDVNNFKPVDFKDSGREALEFYSFISDQLQYMIGITSVWQGINKGESQSGKMTDSLINQTAEKITIKANQKNIAYKHIYKLLCDFILCFSDGDRPYRIDSKFQPEYGLFNKLDMVRIDKSGNPIWVGYDVEISAEPAMNKNREALMQQIVELSTGGFLQPTPQNLLVWKLLNKMNFPNSESILQTLQEQVDQQMQMEQAQMEQQNQIEQQTQNSPTGKLLNSIAQKIGGTNATV